MSFATILQKPIGKNPHRQHVYGDLIATLRTHTYTEEKKKKKTGTLGGVKESERCARNTCPSKGGASPRS
jgi:hypothetical protein